MNGANSRLSQTLSSSSRVSPLAAAAATFASRASSYSAFSLAYTSLVSAIYFALSTAASRASSNKQLL